jgi:hypothetical protein
VILVMVMSIVEKVWFCLGEPRLDALPWTRKASDSGELEPPSQDITRQGGHAHQRDLAYNQEICIPLVPKLDG